MKIFFLPTSYPDAENPHRDIFIYEQAKTLAKLGHQITILHINKLPSKQVFKKTTKLIKEIDDGFAKRYVLDTKTFWENRFPGLNKNNFIKAVKKMFAYVCSKEEFPDVIYAHFSCWAGYAGTILAKEYALPLVTIEHNSKLMKKRIPRSIIEGVRETMNGSMFFLCVSQGLLDSVESKIEKKANARVIPNMIDEQFHYCEPVSKDQFVFLAIGNLHERKGFRELIDTFCKAFSNTDAVCLRIGGDGPEKEKLYSIVQENKREHQIQFIGRLTREETIEEYKQCDCFVLPSKFETYGLVYREALATGRPIITTDHGGFCGADWHEEYGFKIPVENEDALRNAMQKMIMNYGYYDGEKISRLCLLDCSSQIIGRRIESILLEAISLSDRKQEM